MKRICLAALALLLCTSMAKADDIFLPSWRNAEGQDDGSITVEWDDFDELATGQNPYFQAEELSMSPEDYNSAEGTRDNYRINALSFEQAYYTVNYDGTPETALRLIDDLVIDMENFDNDNNSKQFWVQITFGLLSTSDLIDEESSLPGFIDGSLVDVIVESAQSGTDTFDLDEIVAEDSEGTPLISWLGYDSTLGVNFYTVALAFAVSPNPYSETITFAFDESVTNIDVLLDQVVVDTLCSSAEVPEPSTAALMILGLGGLVAFVRRRNAA